MAQQLRQQLQPNLKNTATEYGSRKNVLTRLRYWSMPRLKSNAEFPLNNSSSSWFFFHVSEFYSGQHLHIPISLLWTVNDKYHRFLFLPFNSQPLTAAKQLDWALHPNSQVCYSIQFVGLICILNRDRATGRAITAMRQSAMMDLTWRIAGGTMSTCFTPKQAMSSMCSESAHDSFCVSAPRHFSGNSFWICDANGSKQLS